MPRTAQPKPELTDQERFDIALKNIASQGRAINVAVKEFQNGISDQRELIQAVSLSYTKLQRWITAFNAAAQAVSKGG